MLDIILFEESNIDIPQTILYNANNFFFIAISGHCTYIKSRNNYEIIEHYKSQIAFNRKAVSIVFRIEGSRYALKALWDLRHLKQKLNFYIDVDSIYHKIDIDDVFIEIATPTKSSNFDTVASDWNNKIRSAIRRAIITDILSEI